MERIVTEGFAEKVYRLRDQAGLSQSQFAESLHVSRQTVSKWEMRVSYPEIEKIIAISELFHVSTDYLLKDTVSKEEEASLDRLVIRFLGHAQDIKTISEELVAITRDGVIDDRERVRMNEIIGKLDEATQMIEKIKLGLASVIDP